MRKIILAAIVLVLQFSVVMAQNEDEEKKIQVISRKVEGEIRTLYNDTLYGDIKVLGATDKYITSIQFKEKGNKKEVFSANDIKRFRQVVPFPDRPEFLVDEVYYESAPDPDNPYKKVFLQIEEWK